MESTATEYQKHAKKQLKRKTGKQKIKLSRKCPENVWSPLLQSIFGHLSLSFHADKNTNTQKPI